jgi:hypothetical protein
MDMTYFYVNISTSCIRRYMYIHIYNVNKYIYVVEVLVLYFRTSQNSDLL